MESRVASWFMNFQSSWMRRPGMAQLSIAEEKLDRVDKREIEVEVWHGPRSMRQLVPRVSEFHPVADAGVATSVIV